MQAEFFRFFPTYFPLISHLVGALAEKFFRAVYLIDINSLIGRRGAYFALLSRCCRAGVAPVFRWRCAGRSFLTWLPGRRGSGLGEVTQALGARLIFPVGREHFDFRVQSRFRDLGLRCRARLEKINFERLAGFGQGLKGIGQEGVLLEIPLGRGRETVEEFRVELELGRHFVHQVDNFSEFPATLEEQPGILTLLGPPDNAQDHFHDRIELTVQPLGETNLKALLGQGHFLLQVLLVGLEFRES